MSKNNQHSLFDLGNKAWEAGKVKEAFKLFMAAAKERDIYALNSIGYFFDLGIAVPKNKKKALFWYKKAAKHGDIAAYSNIGTVYRDMRKPELAQLWFQKALKAGDGDAALELGKIYLAKKDFPKARHYLDAAKRSKRITEDSVAEAVRLLKRIPSPALASGPAARPGERPSTPARAGARGRTLKAKKRKSWESKGSE